MKYEVLSTLTNWENNFEMSSSQPNMFIYNWDQLEIITRLELGHILFFGEVVPRFHQILIIKAN